jgi:DnaK suppressor protein
MTAAAQSDAAHFPVRDGERAWSESEIAQVRNRLADEAADLRAEINAAESDIATRLGDAVSDAGDDQADVGAKTYAREHELSLAYNTRDLLAQSERALGRIGAGTYGFCESCGQPIGKARLKAFPRATLCVSCKQREERR